MNDSAEKKDHLVEKEGNPEEKSIAINELQTQLQTANSEIKELNNQLDTAFRSIDLLIKRVAELESSKIYKIRKHLSHYSRRVFKAFKESDKKNMFSIIWNYVIKRGVKVFLQLSKKVLKHIYLWVFPRRLSADGSSGMIATTTEYSKYLINKKLTDERKERIIQESNAFMHKPLFSILIPVYNPPIDFFRQALDSIIDQLYTHWEICLADDCSTLPQVKEVIEEYRSRFPNIKVVYRKENGHISKASNSALELASGEYCVLMDQDDTITPDALFYIAQELNKNPDLDLIYSDEDKVDEKGVYSLPHFKPEWSPESLLSRNYLNHLSVFKTSHLKAIGGWRVGYEGSQDYDLSLRFTEKYNKIKHIPEVLYHWRSHMQSAAGDPGAKPYAHRAAQRAITESLERRGSKSKIDFLEGFRGFKVWIDIEDPSQLVSIIIPSKNNHKYLKRCINSIVEKSTYQNFEIILIDNNSDNKDFFKAVDEWKKQIKFRFKYIRDELPFNFSRLINLGRKHAEGKYLLLLNDDTEVITPEWIEGLMGQAQRPEIGVAGCKLLYGNDTIQHAGVVIGLGDVAGHILVSEDREGPGYFNYVVLLNNFSALTAACCMVRTEVFDHVNGFSEDFEIEYNDVDFCLKILEKGYRNVYVPHVEVYHYESISRGHPLATSESSKKHHKEVNLFKKKWPTYLERDPYYNPNLSRSSQHFAINL